MPNLLIQSAGSLSCRREACKEEVRQCGTFSFSGADHGWCWICAASRQRANSRCWFPLRLQKALIRRLASVCLVWQCCSGARWRARAFSMQSWAPFKAHTRCSRETVLPGPRLYKLSRSPVLSVHREVSRPDARLTSRCTCMPRPGSGDPAYRFPASCPTRSCPIL